MGRSQRSWREDFKLSNLSLNHPYPQFFSRSQWQWHPVIFLTWRILAMIYFVIWIILSGTWEYNWYTTDNNRVKWFIYLTNWSFLLLTVSVIFQAIVVANAYANRLSRGYRAIRNVTPSMTWYLKTNWVLYNISSCAALIVTFGYWVFIYHPGQYVHPVDFVAHGTNSIYILIDFCLTAMPVRLLHTYQCILYSTCYVAFSIIYFLAGGANALDEPYIYDVLDWSNPSSSAVYGAVTILSPLVAWPIYYGLYLLKMMVYRKVYRNRRTHTEGVDTETTTGDDIWEGHGSTDMDDFEV